MTSDLFVLLPLAGFGVAIAYRGWWMYEQFLILTGFILGAVIGVLFSGMLDVNGIVAAGVILVSGAIGAVSYWQLHVVVVALPGFIGGVLVGSLTFGVQLGEWTHPLVVVTGVAGAGLAWAVHRALIVGTTAVIGAWIVGKVAAMWPAFSYATLFEGGMSGPLFLVVGLTGVAVQYRLLTLEEDRDEPIDLWDEMRDWTLQFDESIGRLLKGDVPSRELFGNPPTHLVGRYYVRCPSCNRFGTDDWAFCQYCGSRLTDTDN